MEALLLLVFIFSSSLCAGDPTSLGTGASLAVCQPDTCTLISELAATREKLAGLSQAQKTLENSLRDAVSTINAVQAKLQTSESQVEQLKAVTQAQGEQLKALAATVGTQRTKVAFSAALGTSMGPVTSDTPIKYQRILSNIGSGYNPATGIFTAMVRGVYYFRFTMYNNNAGQPNSVVALIRNGQLLVTTWDTVGSDNHDSASNAAVTQLEVGDNVYMRLSATRQLYDDSNFYNTFSGFLLFTL